MIDVKRFNLLNPDGKALVTTIEESNILDPNMRWESGMEHHPKSKKLMECLETIDFMFADDFFCWKSGGDGDNGEILMYELDMIFEVLDMYEEEL